MGIMSREVVFEAVSQEREYQDKKWGREHSEQQSVAGFLQIIESELIEAKAGWNKNKPGRHSALAEIKQIAAVCVAAMEVHGTVGN